MLKKLIILFKLGRKVAKSDILKIVSKFQEPPFFIKIFFKILSFSLSPKKDLKINKDEGERLSDSLESMGTTFIKLGQMLSNRPDIMPDNFIVELEKLRDCVTPIDFKTFKYHLEKEFPVGRLLY